MIREESIQIPFKYAAGSTGSEFLIALRDDRRILATHCRTCGLVLCQARSFCPHCGGLTDGAVVVGPKGTLEAWTHVPGKGTFGLVRLDGADNAMLHRLLPDVAVWTVGARVQAHFAAQRTGNIGDIEGFEAAEGAS